jgi:hypothetical protein
MTTSVSEHGGNDDKNALFGGHHEATGHLEALRQVRHAATAASNLS